MSEIQDDGATLVCNLGTRDLGTAELILAGMQATGVTGDQVSMSARIGEPGVNEVSASLPELDIVNTFAMDMQFSGGNPTTQGEGVAEHLTFPWSLRHAPGSTAGPDTVSYDLTFTATGGETVTPHLSACSVQDRQNPTYPYSGAGFPPEQTAPFAGTCILTQISANVMRLTLTGIDYSKTIVPVQDTAGVDLPTDWDVVAAGLVNVQFNFDSATTIAYTSTAPTYTSTTGETSVDDPNNNSNSRAATRGVWTGGWRLNQMNPPQDGTVWTDTSRTMAGEVVLSDSGARPPVAGETAAVVCEVLDSKYVTFQSEWCRV